MANRAFVGIWIRDFDDAELLSHFERFLASFPVTAQPPIFLDLTVRAVDPTEAPVLEHDLRGQLLTPADLIELARAHDSSDVAIEVNARWDLWIRDMESVSWKLSPERLSLSCFGTDYDQGAFAQTGHLMADIGFEHLFTGHAGLLAPQATVTAAEHPEEARFVRWMSQPQNLREYHEKTRENIHKLMEWTAGVERALPVERMRLWSEGEENFEARLDEILAVR